MADMIEFGATRIWGSFYALHMLTDLIHVEIHRGGDGVRLSEQVRLGLIDILPKLLETAEELKLVGSRERIFHFQYLLKDTPILATVALYETAGLGSLIIKESSGIKFALVPRNTDKSVR